MTPPSFFKKPCTESEASMAVWREAAREEAERYARRCVREWPTGAKIGEREVYAEVHVTIPTMMGPWHTTQQACVAIEFYFYTGRGTDD